MENKRFQISRRGLLTKGLAGIVSATALNGLSAKGQEIGERDLPREGSYIDGRRVVYIDSSITKLVTPDTYNVLVEPVERSHGDGFVIEADRVTLDGNGQEILGVNGCRSGYNSAVVISGNEVNVLNSINTGFYNGIYSHGNSSVLDDIYIGGNDYGISLEGGEGHLVSNVTAEGNFIEGIHLEPSSRCRISDFAVLGSGEKGVGIFGKNNIFINGIIQGSNPISSDSHTNVFRGCEFDLSEGTENLFTRQIFYRARVLLDNSPVGNALVYLESNTGDLEVALRTEYLDGKTLRVPVTTEVRSVNPFNGVKRKTDFLPYLISVTGQGISRTHIWDGSGEEDLVVLKD